MKLKMPTRMSRAKRSLMISRPGIRPRTMRSCVAMLYGRTPAGLVSSETWSTSPVTPLRRASTSSCDMNSSWPIDVPLRCAVLFAGAVGLLDDEFGEQHVVDAHRLLRRASRHFDRGAQFARE